MVAYATSTYNTGWMNGDIKGAFLSDTSATNLVGSGELITNGTFDTDVSGWTASNAVISWDAAGYIVVDDTADAGADSNASQSITTVVGKTYVLSVDRISTTSAFWLEVFGATQLVYTGSLGATTGPYSVTFVANSTSTSIRLITSGTGVTKYDNVSVKLADADRSVNNNGLIVNGTVTRTAVASGADLVAYSGFSSSNYLEQPYNSDLDFGTGDFCVMGWVKQSSSSVEYFYDRGNGVNDTGRVLLAHNNGQLSVAIGTSAALSGHIIADDTWVHFVLIRRSGTGYLYVNGTEEYSASRPNTVSITNAVARFGISHTGTSPLSSGSLALLRISATAPTAAQILKIYNDEKVLFQTNAQATLYGASDAVTALAHDPDTDLLHVGTSAGRSVFQGLRRISNSTTAVSTAISANNGVIAEQ